MSTPDPACAAARQDRALGCFIGLAVGDAVGTTVEFLPRGSFAPVTDMVGGGPFRLRAGQWTDDTSMALCLAESLLADPDLDELDLMHRFRRWLDEGENSATGHCFDIGTTTRAALDRFRRTGNPIAGDTAPESAGNGSIMRLAPVAVRHWSNPDLARDLAERQSRTTHGAAEAVAACALLADLLCRTIARGAPAPFPEDGSVVRGWPPRIRAIAQGSWRGLRMSQLRSSGYVVHTLTAALWCATRAPDFEQAVLMAANLGDDADTVAAVTGQVAGAMHGLSGIPPHWLERLHDGPRLSALAKWLHAAAAQEA
jgi:ADP-ribosyl-[dinitrogen reductase] hydrolase